jgi:hypothetical protein
MPGDTVIFSRYETGNEVIRAVRIVTKLMHAKVTNSGCHSERAKSNPQIQGSCAYLGLPAFDSNPSEIGDNWFCIL